MHTPGPWAHIAHTGDILAVGEHFTICKVPTVALIDAKAPTELIERSVENARLIAAAPDMLAALEEIRGDIEGDYMLDGKWVDNPSNLVRFIHRAATSAIAKARGEEQPCKSTSET